MRTAAERTTPPAACCRPSANMTVCAASEADTTILFFSTNAQEAKLPVAPQSMSTSAGDEPTKPDSLMRALLVVVTWFTSDVAGGADRDVVRFLVGFLGLPPADAAFGTATEARVAPGTDGAEPLDGGPGSWPESGRSGCPSTEKRFDVVIFCV